MSLRDYLPEMPTRDDFKSTTRDLIRAIIFAYVGWAAVMIALAPIIALAAFVYWLLHY